MANKDMKSLLGGIVGKELTEQRPPLEAEDNGFNMEDITPEMEEGLEAERRKKVGRPKLREKRIRENRATFIMDKELVNRLKYISLVDGRLLKDVAAEAFAEYALRWEKKRNTVIDRNINP